MTHDTRRMLINAVSNTMAFLALLATSFVLAPIVLRALGDESYGAWSFCESFIAYLTLFDMGVAAALVRFVPRALAQDDPDEVNRLYSASLLFFTLGGVFALALGLAFGLLVIGRFLPEAGTHDQFRGLFLILVASFATTLPLSVYPAMLDGVCRFTFKSLVRTAVLVIRIPLTLMVIKTENRLVNLGFVIAGCNILEHIVLALGVFHWLPSVKFRPRNVNRETVTQIARYSRDALAAMFAGRLAFHTDALVIATFLGAVAITPFSLAAKLVDMAKSVLRSATTTLTARFSALDAAGDSDRLRRTFLIGSRAAWYAAVPVQLGLLVLGPSFLRLWIGSRLAMAASPVLLTLSSVLALTIAQSVASRVLYGIGRLQGFAWATLADGLTNVVVSLLLVKSYGIVGVAVGTAIPHTVFCVGIVAFVCRLLGVHLGTYVRQMAGPIIIGAVPAAIWSWQSAHGIESWTALFAGGAVGIGGYALCVFAFEKKRNQINRLRDKHQEVPLLMRRAG